MKLSTLLETVRTVSASADGKTWHPVRPQTAENTFLRHRIKAAWRVLTGRADAVEWDAPPFTSPQEVLTMGELIAKNLPWLLSAITIWMTLMAGNKHPKAWAVGLVNQALWLCWIVASSTWGMLPMNLALWVVYGRNHLKWNRHD